MKGDFSRFTFNPGKHYSSTRMQQGRVQLDADWNEQMDMFNYRVQTEANDFIGGSGAPQANPGFKISLNNNELVIGSGRYYVNGLLCEICENSVPVVFTQQSDYPHAELPLTNGFYLVYLDVWQLLVTAIEDPNIREVALGGADTTTRVRNLAQVKLFYAGTTEPADFTTVANMPAWQKLTTPSSGALTAQLLNPSQLGNQLYRIEIHQSGDDQTAVTFKWSRENGSVLASVQQVTVDSTTNQATIFLDQLQSALPSPFSIGEWVELSNEGLVLQGQPGYLLQIVGMLDDNNALQVNWPQGLDSTQFTTADVATVRLWNGDYTNNNNGIPISTAFIPLENGLQVQFSTGTFRTGDYWLIPSRAITNSIEWPSNTSQTPQGIYHSYAPLALFELNQGNWIEKNDWRTLFSPIISFKALGAVQADPSAPNGSIYIDGKGNVGIGTQTTTLKAKLEVDGTVIVDTLTIGTKLEVDGTATLDTLTITNMNAGSFSQIASPNKVLVADNLGHIGLHWLGSIWLPTWALPPALPTKRSQLASVALNGKVYTLGGNVDSGSSQGIATVECYDSSTDLWSTFPDMQVARNAPCVELVDGRIYAIGGDGDGNTTSGTMEYYDFTAKTWNKVNDIVIPPIGLYPTATTVVNGVLYLLGMKANPQLVQYYDLQNNQLKTVATLPNPRGSGFIAVAIDKNIYVLGGSSNGGTSSIVDVYNVDNNTWNNPVVPASLPSTLPTFGYAATVANGKIYFLGGATVGTNITTVNTVMVYDPGTNHWSYGVSMPTGRAYFTAVTANTPSAAIFVIGGGAPGPNSGSSLIGHIDVYQPSDII